MHFSFDSSYQKKIENSLMSEWLPSGSTVSILQGFPGTGKSSIATSFAKCSEFDPIYWDMNPESQDTFFEFAIDLAAELELYEINSLSLEMDKGIKANILGAIAKTIRKYPLLIVIEDFQYCLDSNSGLPPKHFQDLIQKLNKLPVSIGKLMLISNKRISAKKWNERCFFISIDGLPTDERDAFFKKSLLENNLIEKIPKERIGEIAKRLGGNPRAILTFVSSLFYDPLEDLLSLSPKLFEVGDVNISHKLIMEFELQLVQRSISLADSNARKLLQYLSVYRRVFSKKAFADIPIMEIDSVRHDLVGRYFIHNTSRGDLLHPIAKEIFVSQVRQNSEKWQTAHNLAANYYLASFKVSNKRKYSTVSMFYFELRYHLSQSNRMSEIGAASDRVKRYLLTTIKKSQQSQIPKNKEVLEERIALISLMPDIERPKGLEYHLALCLQERNKRGDFKKALYHIRRAESQNSYYASWLLRLDLENSVKGITSMLMAFEKSLKCLKSDNNVFAVYRRCAEILKQEGDTAKAIEILETGIKKSGAHCYTSIAPLCADYMAESGRTDDAITLLKKGLSTPGVTRVVTLYQNALLYWYRKKDISTHKIF